MREMIRARCSLPREKPVSLYVFTNILWSQCSNISTRIADVKGLFTKKHYLKWRQFSYEGDFVVAETDTCQTDAEAIYYVFNSKIGNWMQMLSSRQISLGSITAINRDDYVVFSSDRSR